MALQADVYGSSVSYQGRVIGLGIGTGSAFSLLPAQNATGNWIKIVQRLPVRIALDPGAVKAHPLRIGLSMQVKVDLHDRSGPLLAHEPAVAGALHLIGLSLPTVRRSLYRFGLDASAFWRS